MAHWMDDLVKKAVAVGRRRRSYLLPPRTTQRAKTVKVNSPEGQVRKDQALHATPNNAQPPYAYGQKLPAKTKKDSPL